MPFGPQVHLICREELFRALAYWGDYFHDLVVPAYPPDTLLSDLTAEAWAAEIQAQIDRWWEDGTPLEGLPNVHVAEYCAIPPYAPDPP